MRHGIDILNRIGKRFRLIQLLYELVEPCRILRVYVQPAFIKNRERLYNHFDCDERDCLFYRLLRPAEQADLLCVRNEIVELRFRQISMQMRGFGSQKLRKPGRKRANPIQNGWYKAEIDMLGGCAARFVGGGRNMCMSSGFISIRHPFVKSSVSPLCVCRVEPSVMMKTS